MNPIPLTTHLQWCADSRILPSVPLPPTATDRDPATGIPTDVSISSPPPTSMSSHPPWPYAFPLLARPDDATRPVSSPAARARSLPCARRPDRPGESGPRRPAARSQGQGGAGKGDARGPDADGAGGRWEPKCQVYAGVVRVRNRGQRGQVLTDCGPTPRQSILKGYQNVLLQLQDISSYIASTTVRSGLQPGAPSINPFAHALVHLQAPIPADNDSIGRLEYMAVPARLPAALEAERALFEENWPAAADWPTDEQIAGMMPNELGEVHDAVGRELAETRRRMARARAILGQLGEGFDWRMREADDKEEGEEEEGGGEEGERLADGAAATPAESGAADTPASRDDLFGDESNESGSVCLSTATPSKKPRQALLLHHRRPHHRRAGPQPTA